MLSLANSWGHPPFTAMAFTGTRRLGKLQDQIVPQPVPQLSLPASFRGDGHVGRGEIRDQGTERHLGTVRGGADLFVIWGFVHFWFSGNVQV